jgi:hypothetical protein
MRHLFLLLFGWGCSLGMLCEPGGVDAFSALQEFRRLLAGGFFQIRDRARLRDRGVVELVASCRELRDDFSPWLVQPWWCDGYRVTSSLSLCSPRFFSRSNSRRGQRKRGDCEPLENASRKIHLNAARAISLNKSRRIKECAARIGAPVSRDPRSGKAARREKHRKC